MNVLIEKAVLPIGMFTIITFAALVFLILKRRRTAKILLSFGILFILTLSIPFVGKSLVFSLERNYMPVPTSSLKTRTVTILAGGGVTPPYGIRERAELGFFGDRLAYAAELYLEEKTQKILVTAGNLHREQKPLLSEAEYSRDILVSWGVEPNDIIIEPFGKTTNQNVRYVSKILRKLPNRDLYVVSSAYHLPRLFATLCSSNVSAFPLAANRLVSTKPSISLNNAFPSIGGLWLSSLAIRENIGIAYYQIRGYISANTKLSTVSCD